MFHWLQNISRATTKCAAIADEFAISNGWTSAGENQNAAALVIIGCRCTIGISTNDRESIENCRVGNTTCDDNVIRIVRHVGDSPIIVAKQISGKRGDIRCDISLAQQCLAACESAIQRNASFHRVPESSRRGGRWFICSSLHPNLIARNARIESSHDCGRSLIRIGP